MDFAHGHVCGQMFPPTFVTSIFTAVLLATPTIAVTADPSRALETIRAIGPEGQGNAAASAAWKELGGGSASMLVPILEGMNGANDYSLNWLRSAFDAIVSRELQHGKQLPLPELGKFLLDTRHHPRARSLVFDLLSDVDSDTTTKLLAGMLNDPSMDIRRVAIEQLMQQTDRTLAAGNKAGAAILLQQALGHARDPKQIESIAKKLNDLHQPVD
jgi:hypothetical protein